MAKPWKEDQDYLLKAIPEYRNKITSKQLDKVREITKDFATNLHATTPQLHHRSVQSIYERLPYLDNLLAGLFDKSNYALKDQYLFATLPRSSGDKEPNLCNTRHSYKGAIR